MCFARLRTYAEPPETDLSTYWLIGRELLHGKKLYSEVWDLKPPAIYWTYAAAQWLFPTTELCRYALWCAASLVTLGCVYSLARHWSRSRLAGLTAALLWTVVAGDCWLQANQPNTEVFINAALVAALLILTRSQAKRSRLIHTFLAGLLVGVATLYKTVVLVAVPLFTIGIFAQRQRQGLIGGAAGKASVCFWAGVATAWGVTASVLAFQGVFDAFMTTILDWGKWYSGNLIENLIAGLHPSRLFPDSAKHVLPTALLTLLGIRGIARVRGRGVGLWLALWGASCFLIYALPGRFYPHYYQVFLPLFCVVSGFSWWGLRIKVGMRTQRTFRKAFVASLIAMQAIIQSPFYFRSGDSWSLAKYGSDFIEDRDLGVKIRSILEEDETLYVWGTNPGIIEASQRRPASGIFFCIPLLWGPTTATLTQQVVKDFSTSPPELVVINVHDVPAPATHPVVRWFLENCVGHRLLNTSNAKFRLFCRLNGSLQRRLENQNRGLQQNASEH